MKNVLILSTCFLLLFSCKNHQNTIVCKNEVKIKSVKKRNFKPYHYSSASSKEVTKINDGILKKKEENNADNQEESIYASSNEYLELDKNPILERVKRVRVKKDEDIEEDQEISPTWHTFSIISFVVYILGLVLTPLWAIGLGMCIVSLFILRNKKDRYRGKGFAFIPVIVNASGSFLFGLLLIALGGNGNWGALLALFGVGLLIFSLILGAILFYYFYEK